FDLAPVATAARGLVERADALATALARLAATTPGAAALERANRALVRLSRILVPLAYTTGDPFRHDLALPPAPLARLQAVRDPGRRAEARRDAHDRAPHRSRVARPPLRDDRARRVGLLEHPRVVNRDRREARALPEARDVVGRDLADAGALQAAVGCPVPRRD